MYNKLRLGNLRELSSIPELKHSHDYYYVDSSGVVGILRFLREYIDGYSMYEFVGGKDDGKKFKFNGSLSIFVFKVGGDGIAKYDSMHFDSWYGTFFSGKSSWPYFAVRDFGLLKGLHDRLYGEDKYYVINKLTLRVNFGPCGPKNFSDASLKNICLFTADEFELAHKFYNDKCKEYLEVCKCIKKELLSCRRRANELILSLAVPRLENPQDCNTVLASNAVVGDKYYHYDSARVKWLGPLEVVEVVNDIKDGYVKFDDGRCCEINMGLVPKSEYNEYKRSIKVVHKRYHLNSVIECLDRYIGVMSDYSKQLKRPFGECSEFNAINFDAAREFIERVKCHWLK